MIWSSHFTRFALHLYAVIICVFAVVFRRGSGFYSKISLEGSDVDIYGVFTNNHVLGSLCEAENASATFGYEGSSGGVKVKLRPEVIFRTNKVSI